MAVLGLPDWQQRILKQLGAPATPANLNFVNAWQRAEGGGATNNPFNTTLPMPGASSYNSVGVRNYGSPQQGLQATIDTLRNGRYGDIVKALQRSNPTAAVSALGASPWGTSASLVGKILGEGGTVAPSAPIPPSPEMPPPATLPASATLPLSPLPTPMRTAPVETPPLAFGASPKGFLQSLVQQAISESDRRLNTPTVINSRIPPPPGVATSPVPDASAIIPTSGAAVKGAKPGDPIPIKFQTSISPEHDTAGLAGFPAHDYMSHAGAPVVAPASGKIVRFSGHDPRDGPTSGVHGPFGWSIYLQGDDGKTYYMTHLGARDVKVGQRVEAGVPIATVGNYAKWGGADHVHMGVSATPGSWNN